LCWFEDPYKLDRLIEIAHYQMPVVQMPWRSGPGVGFIEWARRILESTSMSPNALLLAILLVYRFRRINTDLQPKSGSEYKVFIVSLILANKSMLLHPS
jgi:hypothetical protein